MCGIIGAVNGKAVVSDLIGGLRRLEYRGYDSAGLATLLNGDIACRRSEGKLENLESVLAKDPVEGQIGIAHTRWATHGAPTTINAHPHATDRVAVVHNGIIENFKALRDELIAEGHRFESDTDTEVIPRLITHYLETGLAPDEATARALQRLEGAYALGILFKGEEEHLIAARQGSPLVLGYGENATYLGSDAIALAGKADELCYLEDGDWAVLRQDGAEIRDAKGRAVSRPVRRARASGASVGKNGYRHYMLKEIHEQPNVVRKTLGAHYDPQEARVRLPELPFDFASLSRLTIVACGTSYYAGQVSKYWFEKYARLPVEVDIASEFRYRESPMPEGGAALFISQSGETADTLAALRHCRAENQHIISVVNVPDSTIARESDLVLETLAGPEIGVASTKAFTTQLTVLACLAIAAGEGRGTIASEEVERLTAALGHLPSQMEGILEDDSRYEAVARDMAKATTVLFIGRGTSYPIALEGALKLKEISYIHAEGYGAGELKHGPIALIDETVPVVVVAPSDGLFDKTISNLHEIQARGGRIVLISDADGNSKAGDDVEAAFEVPNCHDFTLPILLALPVQLLAYHMALRKGTDIDQPRNLAKSVTVE